MYIKVYEYNKVEVILKAYPYYNPLVNRMIRLLFSTERKRTQYAPLVSIDIT